MRSCFKHGFRRIDAPHVHIIGHRGAMLVAPENTILSFKKAKQQGACGVEFDLRKCKSGEVVVIHDESVDRTTTGKGKVKELSLSELKKLTLGKNQTIPTLEEALDFCKRSKLFAHLEIKELGFEDKVVREIRKRNLYNLARISSFKKGVLAKIKRLDQKIETGLLCDKLEKNLIKEAKRLKVKAIHLRLDLLTKELVERLHKEGFLVFAWTPSKMKITLSNQRKAILLGIDELGTNDPSVALKALSSKN